jgi:cupin fold WbuC family metalloprotein
MMAIATFWSLKSIEQVKRMALESEKKYARLCAHPNVDDVMHEMLIAVHRDAEVGWHWHEYEESMTVLEGSGILTYQSADMPLQLRLDRQNFFVRITDGCIHRPRAESEFLVFIETAPGPWRKEKTRWIGR